MKLFTAVLMMTLAACLVNAQNYLINFAGSGAGITVDSVKVENLSQCTSLSLSGTDTLLLRKEVGIGEITNRNDISLQVSPNPSAGKFSLSIQTPESRGVTLSICDLSGKVLLNRDEILETGKSLFLLGGLKSGLYILNAVSGNSYLTVKIISTGGEGGSPVLLKGGSVPAMNNPLPSSGFSESNGCRGSASVISMKFNPGDTLKLTGKSGIYRTVIMLFPTSSQTVTFPFVDCSDIDGNHYAVVRIGSQLWMGENLRTTKYLDGSDIPNVTDSAAWGSLTTGAYCNFHNLPEEGETYGRLYNFYAVDDSLGICPVGWHVPSTSEWNFLEIYLDSTVDTTALG
ncbi:MAG TPA: FISUMP domain-containing protein, partial [Bacteroidales bacterium]|nr:FISUMP domain-containing protein [Bacteroidales bacterium]